MRTVFGRQMPAHCAQYFDDGSATRRLSCLRLEMGDRGVMTDGGVLHLGAVDEEGGQRLYCTCAPVCDYTGREVARVGVFGHGPDDTPILTEHNRGAWDLARLVSMRLGHVPQPGLTRH